jgi:hypothetical protein
VKATPLLLGVNDPCHLWCFYSPPPWNSPSYLSQLSIT